jgi:hypothetical protein
MPRPPHDRQEPTRDLDDAAEAAWPSSVTELQRRAQEMSARDVRDARPEPDDEALSTGRLRGRKGRRGGAPRRSQEITRRVDPASMPTYREPLDVRAGQAIVGGVRRAGGRTLDYLRSLSGQRLWTMVALALLGGALIGGIAAFAMRRALSDKPAGSWAGAREPASAAEAAAVRELVAAGRGASPEPTSARLPVEPREPGAREPGAREPGAREPGAREPATPREPAAREPAAPRPPPPPVGRTLAANSPATLIIVSEPFGADIAVNGQSTGLKTPDSVEGLAPGRTYKVTLTRKGFHPWQEDVEITSGGPRHVSARLAPSGKARAATSDRAPSGRKRRR